MPPGEGRSNRIRAGLARMLAHPQFSKTKVLKALLSYLVERALDGGHISESQIATDVFQIPTEDFHPYTHPHVRVQMHNLRKRIAAYYEDVPNEALRITLPENSYLPVFEMLGSITPETRRAVNLVRLLAESRFPAELREGLRETGELLAQFPSLGIAWALRAEILIMLAIHGDPPLERLREAEAAAQKAISFAPEAWESHVVMGGVQTCLHWNWDEARLSFERAIAAGGGLRAATHPWRQIHMMATGHAGELAELMEELLETQQNPLHMAQVNYGICLHVCRRYHDAVRELERASVLYPSDHSSLSWLASVQWTMGHRARALVSQVKAAMRAKRSPPGEMISLSAKGMSAATTGRKAVTIQPVEEGGNTEISAALTSLIFGRHEKAIASFERMAANRFPLLPMFLHLEMVDVLWRYPRFQQLTEQLRYPDSAHVYRKKAK